MFGYLKSPAFWIAVIVVLVVANYAWQYFGSKTNVSG